MLEVANFEHARFGVLSQCYSFSGPSPLLTPILPFPNISSRKIHTSETKAPQTRLSHKALVEQTPPWEAVFSGSASVIACPPIDLVFSLLPNPVLRTSMPAQMKWQLE
jgi:hypothetical protein